MNKAYDNAQYLRALEYRGNSQSKMKWEVDIMKIIHFLFDLDGEKPSRINKLQRRQFEVYGGYKFEWDKLSNHDQDHIHFLMGEDRKQEMYSIKQAPQPFIMFVKSYVHGTSKNINSAYNVDREMLRSWQSLQNLEPIPKLNMLYFVQSVERCEFNAHLLAIVIAELMKNGNLLLKKKGFAEPGVISKIGIAKGLAKIQSNPLQVPYGPSENFLAQTMWINNPKQSIKTPGYLYKGKLPHVVLWFDVLQQAKQPKQLQQVFRYYLDAAPTQINIFDSPSSFKLAQQLEYLDITEEKEFEHDRSINMLIKQIHNIGKKLSEQTAQDLYIELCELLKSIDSEMHTHLFDNFSKSRQN